MKLVFIAACVTFGCRCWALSPDKHSHVQALIDQLEVYDTPRFEQIFDKNARPDDGVARAQKAAKELEALECIAIPELLKSLQDPRDSIPFESVYPTSVGAACWFILERILCDLPPRPDSERWRKGADGEMHDRPPFDVSPFRPGGIAKWLEERPGKSLEELRVELIEWTIEREREIGVATLSDYEKYIKPLEQHLKRLKPQVAKKNGDLTMPAKQVAPPNGP